MRKLSIEEIKQLSFKVLCRVRDVCEANGITYSLTGGTLIGAARHQGFIPWDDDIDIMMPRPDYDRFIQIVRNGEYGFDLHCAEMDGPDYGYTIAKACHRNTVVRENGSGTEVGVFVDIFPVDGAGDQEWSAGLRAKVFVFLHGLKISANWTSFRRSKLRRWYYEPLRYLCYLLSKLLGKKQIDRMVNSFLRSRRYEDCAYVGRLLGDHGSHEVMPKALFEGTCRLPFEGELFDAIAGYDAFLTRLYGDYMQLPPPDKQATHHEFEAYWVE